MTTDVLNEKETNRFIMSKLAKSKSRIWICSPWITRKDIKKYLQKVKDVKIILGFSNKRDFRISDLSFLEEINNQKNVQVRVNKRAHRKVYVFDSFALIGSSNLTYMGLGQNERYNLETSVISDDKKIVTGAIRHFKETWKDSIPFSDLDVEIKKKKPKIRGIKEILELFKPHNPLERILD